MEHPGFYRGFEVPAAIAGLISAEMQVGILGEAVYFCHVLEMKDGRNN